jgi:site-specific recombinase
MNVGYRILYAIRKESHTADDILAAWTGSKPSREMFDTCVTLDANAGWLQRSGDMLAITDVGQRELRETDWWVEIPR